MRAGHGRLLTAALCLAMLLGSLWMLTGCFKQTAEPIEGESQGSAETTAAFDNAVKKPEPPQVPPQPMLKRGPEQAAYSYLVWISFAYRILNSDVASQTFTMFEEVRVNSYVQLNRQQGRALDQRLLDFHVKGQPDFEGTTTATVSAVETWKYRYIDIKDGTYSGPWHDAVYDSTYTVIVEPSRREWVVHKVDATPRGEVK